ncbi:MAG: EAL domain-containing protein [Alphaproteobacteria bacterium]
MLTNEEFSKALGEARVSLALEPICNLRQRKADAHFARVEGTAAVAGIALEAFALQEGRSRELALYLYDLAAKALKETRAAGVTGQVYFPLAARDIEDQTLADSLRQIAGRHGIVPESTTLIAPLKDYFATATASLPALLRLRFAGFGLGIAIDSHQAPRFRPLPELPATALCLSGSETWRRLRTAGPGKLGALGSWIGWAESQGLKRIALDIVDATAEETARLYGFPLAAGPNYAALSWQDVPGSVALRRSSG